MGTTDLSQGGKVVDVWHWPHTSI